MTRQHSKSTVIILNGKDLSAHSNASTLTLTSDIHDLTTYGKDDHVNAGGLGTSGISMGGWYDTQATTGPRAVLIALRGQTVTCVHRPEGTGSGKPQDSFSVVVGQYVETKPIADYVSWTCELTGSDTVDQTPQP